MSSLEDCWYFWPGSLVKSPWWPFRKPVLCRTASLESSPPSPTTHPDSCWRPPCPTRRIEGWSGGRCRWTRTLRRAGWGRTWTHQQVKVNTTHLVWVMSQFSVTRERQTVKVRPTVQERTVEKKKKTLPTKELKMSGHGQVCALFTLTFNGL